jgi:hypothetical protein
MAARLQLEDGNGEIEVLYMDTPAVRVRNAGSVALADETLDVVINPKVWLRHASPIRMVAKH